MLTAEEKRLETPEEWAAFYVHYGTVMFPRRKMKKRQLDPEVTKALVKLHEVAYRRYSKEGFINDHDTILASLNACMELKVPSSHKINFARVTDYSLMQVTKDFAKFAPHIMEAIKKIHKEIKSAAIAINNREMMRFGMMDFEELFPQAFPGV